MNEGRCETCAHADPVYYAAAGGKIPIGFYTCKHQPKWRYGAKCNIRRWLPQQQRDYDG